MGGEASGKGIVYNIAHGKIVLLLLNDERW